MKKSESRGLEALIGQDDARIRLKEILASPGAGFLLITGEEGSGKHFVSRLLAKSMLCAQPSENGACGLCDSCHLFDAGNHVDFHEPLPDSKTLISTAAVREAINDLHVMPRIGEHQVIVLNGNFLNEQGQNALLKSLETPPPSVTFIMLADNEMQMLPTIRSRAVRIHLTARAPDALRQILQAHGVIAEDALARAVTYADGNPGRALTLAGSPTYPVMRETALRLFFALPKRRVADLLSEDLNALKTYKDAADSDVSDIFHVWSEQLRDAFVLHVGQEPVLSTERERLAQFLEALTPLGDTAGRLERCQREIVRVRRALSAYASADTALAHLLLFLRKELHA